MPRAAVLAERGPVQFGARDTGRRDRAPGPTDAPQHLPLLIQHALGRQQRARGERQPRHTPRIRVGHLARLGLDLRPRRAPRPPRRLPRHVHTQRIGARRTRVPNPVKLILHQTIINQTIIKPTACVGPHFADIVAAGPKAEERRGIIAAAEAAARTPAFRTRDSGAPLRRPPPAEVGRRKAAKPHLLARRGVGITSIKIRAPPPRRRIRARSPPREHRTERRDVQQPHGCTLVGTIGLMSSTAPGDHPPACLACPATGVPVAKATRAVGVVPASRC